MSKGNNCLHCKRNRTPNSTLAEIRLTQNQENLHKKFEISCRINYISKLHKRKLSIQTITNQSCQYFKPI